MSKNNRTLYGQPIIDDSELTYAEQVHDILCQEIHSGHWQVGERMPSLAELVDLSGLSMSPIRQAVEMLAGEGYIRQAMRKGTYLKAILPQGRTPLGAIGVVKLALEPWTYATHPAIQWRVHEIQQAASERNYTTEVAYLQKGEGWDSIDLVGGRFSEQVKGIISLYPFPHPTSVKVPSDRIPLVFLGTHEDGCSPCVTGDLTEGAYQLTKRVIEAGHRQVVLHCHPDLIKPMQSPHPEILSGHERAMAEAGLAVNRDALQLSVANSGAQTMRSLREFIERFSEATAIVTMSGSDALSIIEVADMLGIRVPEDLSVATLAPGLSNPLDSDKRLTSLSYDYKRLNAAAFDLLFEMIKTRRSPFTRLALTPSVRQGDTLGPPRREGALAPSGVSTSREEAGNADRD
jgi:GntR family transcriptional regulator of arabinose operon